MKEAANAASLNNHMVRTQDYSSLAASLAK